MAQSIKEFRALDKAEDIASRADARASLAAQTFDCEVHAKAHEVYEREYDRARKTGDVRALTAVHRRVVKYHQTQDALERRRDATFITYLDAYHARVSYIAKHGYVRDETGEWRAPKSAAERGVDSPKMPAEMKRRLKALQRKRDGFAKEYDVFFAKAEKAQDEMSDAVKRGDVAGLEVARGRYLKFFRGACVADDNQAQGRFDKLKLLAEWRATWLKQ